MLEPRTGLEPATSTLQVLRSANWATVACHFVYCVYFFLSFLPLPLFAALYVAVNEWQFGQRSSRLSSELLVWFPSLWWTSSGMFPVYRFTSLQPHCEHLLLYFSYKYLFMWDDMRYFPLIPSSNPSFHLSMYLLYWKSIWHLLEQYLFLLGIEIPQFKQ